MAQGGARTDQYHDRMWRQCCYLISREGNIIHHRVRPLCGLPLISGFPPVGVELQGLYHFQKRLLRCFLSGPTEGYFGWRREQSFEIPMHPVSQVFIVLRNYEKLVRDCMSFFRSTGPLKFLIPLLQRSITKYITTDKLPWRDGTTRFGYLMHPTLAAITELGFIDEFTWLAALIMNNDCKHWV